MQLRPPDLQRRLDLFNFDSPEKIKLISCGCDADLGGKSEAYISFSKCALFSGTVSNFGDGKNESTGYAGFMTRTLDFSLFGSRYHNLEEFNHILVTARQPDAGINGNEAKVVMLNIKSTAYSYLDLYQYPLKFPNNEWQTFQIPIRHFLLTHNGYILKIQREMEKSHVDGIGMSILEQKGPFAVEIKEIAVTNPPGLSDEEMEAAFAIAKMANDQHALNELEKISNEYKIN